MSPNSSTAKSSFILISSTFAGKSCTFLHSSIASDILILNYGSRERFLTKESFAISLYFKNSSFCNFFFLFPSVSVSLSYSSSATNLQQCYLTLSATILSQVRKSGGLKQLIPSPRNMISRGLKGFSLSLIEAYWNYCIYF